MEDLEHIYDEKISPLMAQVLAICKKHGVPMFAEFQYSEDGFCKSRIDTGHPIIAHLDALSQSKVDDGINVDKYMFWVAKAARERGHGSMVLSQMGIPNTPDADS